MSTEANGHVYLGGDARRRTRDSVLATPLALDGTPNDVGAQPLGNETGQSGTVTPESPGDPSSSEISATPPAHGHATANGLARSGITDIRSGAHTLSPRNQSGELAPGSSGLPAAVTTQAASVTNAVVGKVSQEPLIAATSLATPEITGTSAPGFESVTLNAPSQVLSAQELTDFVDQLSSALSTIEDLLTSKVFTEPLPLLGNILGTSTDQALQKAVSAFQTFESDLLAEVRSLAAGVTTQQLADALNAGATAAGFGGLISATVDSSDDLVVSLGDSGSFTASPKIDPGLGLLGFGLVGTATAQVTLGYKLQQQITLDSSGNLVQPSGPSAPPLQVSLTVGAPQFSADVDLGFLKFTASDPGTYLKGTFDVNADGSVGFQGSANLALKLQTHLGSAAFPAMSAELDGSWQFGNASTGTFANVDPSDPSAFGNEPTIELNNVSIDLGSFLRNFLGPIYNDIISILSPIQPFIDFFDETSLLDLLSHLGISNSDAIKYFDKAGLIDPSSSTGLKGDGNVTLLDFLALDTGNQGVQQLVTALSVINEIEQLGSVLGLAGGGDYNLGSFQISGDIRSPGFNIQTDVPTGLPNTLADAKTLTDALGHLTGLDTSQLFDLTQSLVPDAPGSNGSNDQPVTIGSPLLSDPLSAAELLLGNGSPELFTLDLQPSVALGEPYATPPQDEPIAPPLGIPGIITLALNAALGAQLNLEFGYDTTGLQDFVSSGFSDPTQFLNGFYVSPISVNGNVLPVANLVGDLFAGVTLFDSIDAGGFVNADANASFATPGKQYLPLVGSAIVSNPASLFDLSGTVSAGARIDTLLAGETIFSVTPYSDTFFTWSIGNSPNQEPGSPGPISYADNPGRGEIDINGDRSPNFTPDDFEDKDNWSNSDATSSFNISNDGSVAYFGLATIGLNALETIDLQGGISKPVFVHNVTISGRYIDDLQSLDLIGSDPDGHILDFYGKEIVSYGTQIPQTDLIQTGGLVIIEGTGGISRNFSQMTITNLGFSGGFANLGTIVLNGTLGVDSTSKLFGPGTLESESGLSFIQPFMVPTAVLSDLPNLPSTLRNPANGSLDNEGNTIRGAFDITVPITNQGTINADSTAAPTQIHNEGSIINSRLLEADPTPVESFNNTPDDTTQLIIETQATVYNYGGTIAAANGGEVILDYATVWGGLLTSTSANARHETGITVQDNVTFDGNLPPPGGPDGDFPAAGLDIEGTVNVGGYGFQIIPLASTLTLTGLIDTKPYFQNKGSSVVEVIGGQSQLLLQNVTLQGGDYVAMPRGATPAGAIRVVGTATIATQLVLDSHGYATGTPGVAFGGDVQVGNGAVLQVSGVVAPDPREVNGALLTTRILLNGGTILADGFAELAQNSDTSDALPVIGTLVMTDGAANVVGDIGSTPAIFKNEWLIEGAGQLGDGAAEIINDNSFQDNGTIVHPAGTIDANAVHSLTLNGGSIGVLNRGLIEATNGGELILTGEVNNQGGTIAATAGSVFIDNGTVASGLLTATFGFVDAGGLSELDGSTSPLTIASSVDLFVGSAADALDILYLKGVILNYGTLQIFGSTSGIALASVDHYATLMGGGSVLLTDPVAAPGVGHAGITAPVSGYVLDNVDNFIHGNGILAGSVTNETAGVIESGTNVLTVNGDVANAGVMVSTSGELYISGYIQNLDGTVAAKGGEVVLAGGTINNCIGAILLQNFQLADGDTGTIEALSYGGKSGIVVVAGLVQGGYLLTDAKDPHSVIQAGSSGGVLDGTKYDVEITSGSQVLIGAGDTLELEGTIANLGTVSIIGNGATATLLISGSAALAYGGLVTLSDGSGADSDATQVIAGENNGSLDNIDNTISGVGLLGAGSVAITNEAAGSIIALGGWLVIDAGGNGFINHGQVTAAVASTLVLAGNVFDTGATLTADAGTIIVQGTVAGGSFAAPDSGQIWSDSGTLDGSTNAVTIESGATFDILAALPGATINDTGLLGTIVNQGEIFLQSDSSRSHNHRSILLTGAVHLTGGGLIALSDLSSTGGAATDAILGERGSDTLDNVNNRIVGFGTIGGTGVSALTLTNEAAGTIEATSGELFLRVFGTGNQSTNQGLIESVGGTLDLSGTINNAGGTISVLNDGDGHTGTLLIDGLTIQGGLLTSDLIDRASLMEVTTNNGTLDGTAIAVTLAPGAQVQVPHDTKLTLLGSIVDQGTIEVVGHQSQIPVFYAGDANLVIAGTVALTGTGTVLLNHLAGVGQEYGNAVVAGTSSADTLDNASTISGVGYVGGQALTINNLPGGLISANGGDLVVETGVRNGNTISNGARPVNNTGVLSSVNGELDLLSDVANAGGTIAAAAGGITLLDENIVTGGTFDGSAGGEVLVTGATIDGRTSPVTLTSSAIVGLRYDIPYIYYNNLGLTLTGNFINHGTLLIDGKGGANEVSINILGSVSLSGGGQILLADETPTVGGPVSFLGGTGNSADTSDYLDNVDNTITGIGDLGNTFLMLTNEAAGTISATSAGTMLITTLSSNSVPTAGGVVNKGTIQALGGTIELAAEIDNQGGTIEARNDGMGHSGTVSLQGGTIAGGLFLSDPNDPGSFVEASNYDTTLDGNAAAVTLGAGNTLHIVPDSEVIITGTIINLGTVTIFSDTQSGVTPEIMVTGTAHLMGGGRIAMGSTPNADDYIRGNSGVDLLDNVDNTIIGFGEVGRNDLSLTNESAGTIAAQGGQLEILETYPDDNFVNQGLLEALGGSLEIQGTIDNVGGTITTRNDALGNSGTVDLVSTTVQGGVLVGDTTDAASVFVISRSTLDGSVNAVTIAASAQIQDTQHDLTLKGSILDMGTIAVVAAESVSFYSQAILQISDHVTLGGGGTLALIDYSDKGGSYDQVVTGNSSADILDNVNVTITGVGQLGDGTLSLINEAGGNIVAGGGALIVDTGSVVAVNDGHMGAVAGAELDITSAINNAGGTIGDGGGIVLLDNHGAISGGTLDGVIAGNYGTLDGSSGSVTITARATVEVISTFPNPYSKPLYLEGTITNRGVMLLSDDDSGSTVRSDLIVVGTVTLNGRGLVRLTGATAKDTGAGNYITGSSKSDTLDNIDNTIAGFGNLGAGALTLINESVGTVDAVGGSLLIGTGTAVINKGIIRALGGTLELAGLIDNHEGTIEALSDGMGHSGTVSLQGGTIAGGLFLSDPEDTGGFVEASNYDTTLDGGAAAITLGPGNTLRIVPDSEVTLTGTIINLGTVTIYSDTQSGVSPAIIVSGTARLMGGGRIAISSTGAVNDYIRGSSGADLLDNVDNMIIGFGHLGWNEMSLTNESAGTIAAQGGQLDILETETGDNLVNQGLLEALGGYLEIQGAVNNVGGTIVTRNDGAGHSGTVDLGSTSIRGGVLAGDATDSASVFVVKQTVLDGSVNAVTLAASAQIQDTQAGLTLIGSIVDQGTIAVVASQSVSYYSQAILHISGLVTLGGGGTLALVDYSGLGGSADQIVTGASSTDTLDNVDVTITGVGLLGDGKLSLINEAGGNIVASAGGLVVDTGSAVAINRGHIGAVGGHYLYINSHIDNTGGTIGNAAGVVVLGNNGTISGGTLDGVIAGDYGTIDGTSGIVMIAAGATVEVLSTLPNNYTKTLSLEGTISNRGRILLTDDDSGYPIQSDLTLAGTVTLDGGGMVSLTGATAKDTGTANYIYGGSPSDGLDNIDNTIEGFGTIGDGPITLRNESAGTIDAVAGALVVYTGTTEIINKGLMTAGSKGVLHLYSTVANAGGTISADGGTTELDRISVLGGTLNASSGGVIQVVNAATLDGAASGVVLTSGALLAISSNNTLTLHGSVTDRGVISNSGTIINNAAFDLDGTLINQGLFFGGLSLVGSGALINQAGRIIPGTVSATGAGETIYNLGILAGSVSLAGGDRVVTGAGAVFTSGITSTAGGNTLEIATGPYALTNFDVPGTSQYSTLEIDAGVTVVTDASDILAGVTLINHGHLTLTGSPAQTSVQNDGSVTGDFTLDNGGSLVNKAGGTISGIGLAAIEAIAGPAYVINSGLIDPAAYGVDLVAGGTVTNNAGGVIEGTIAGVAIAGGPGTVINSGAITGGGPDAVILAAGYANRVVVSPGAVFAGTVDGGNPAGANAVSTLELAASSSTGTLAGVGTSFINFGLIEIDPNAKWYLEGDQAGFAATISGFTNGDTIVLDGVTADGSHYANGILTLTDTGTQVATVRFQEPSAAGTLQVTTVPGGVEIEIPCFLAGTLILTDKGEVPVEKLVVGDHVRTLSGESRPIVWIGSGRRKVRPGQRCAATPVLVCRGALTDGIPHRDLRVTKGHSLYLDGVLIPAEFLINHRSVRWDDHVQTVEYYHIELAAHDVLLANGAAAESYRDDGNRHLFVDLNESWNGPPKPPYAPVLTGGPKVDAVWREVLKRAGPRPSMPLTEDPDLHLLVDGCRVDARTRTRTCHVFQLPSGPQDIRIASRSGVPAEIGLGRDPRALGVALRQARLWRGAQVRVMPASSPTLVAGFHAYEPTEEHRWTNGEAVLPNTFFKDLGSGAVLEVHTRGVTQYAL